LTDKIERSRLEVYGFACLGLALGTWGGATHPDTWLTAVWFFAILGGLLLVIDFAIFVRKVIKEDDAYQAPAVKRFECPHDDPLCKRYGCLDDPKYIGDRS
jgi:hypothetical protein